MSLQSLTENRRNEARERGKESSKLKVEAFNKLPGCPSSLSLPLSLPGLGNVNFLEKYQQGEGQEEGIQRVCKPRRQHLFNMF